MIKQIISECKFCIGELEKEISENKTLSRDGFLEQWLYELYSKIRDIEQYIDRID